MSPRRRRKNAVRAFARLFGRYYCSVCGYKMVTFRHPTRRKCPNINAHAAIFAEQRSHRGRSGRGPTRTSFPRGKKK